MPCLLLLRVKCWTLRAATAGMPSSSASADTGLRGSISLCRCSFGRPTKPSVGTCRSTSCMRTCARWLTTANSTPPTASSRHSATSTRKPTCASPRRSVARSSPAGGSWLTPSTGTTSCPICPAGPGGKATAAWCWRKWISTSTPAEF